MARGLILLIIVAAFSIWAGFALRDIDRRYSSIAFIVGGLLTLLAAGGFFGLL